MITKHVCAACGQHLEINGDGGEIDCPNCGAKVVVEAPALPAIRIPKSAPVARPLPAVAIPKLPPKVPSSREPVDSPVAPVAHRILENIEKVIVDKHAEVALLLTAYFAEGHVLLEDVPGVAKTMLARALASSVGASFKRIQCTPDLLPNDITGSSIFNPKNCRTCSLSKALSTMRITSTMISQRPSRWRAGSSFQYRTVQK